MAVDKDVEQRGKITLFLKHGSIGDRVFWAVYGLALFLVFALPIPSIMLMAGAGPEVTAPTLAAGELLIYGAIPAGILGLAALFDIRWRYIFGLAPILCVTALLLYLLTTFPVK